MTKIFAGKTVAQKKERQLAKKIADFKGKTGITPKLVSIVVGHNPASHLYLRFKEQSAERVGIEFEKIEFPESTKAEEIIRIIQEKNHDEKVHGIMVQLPLPESLEIRNSKLEILESIDPKKDVDCLTSENFNLLTSGNPRFLPATVKAVLEIIELSNYRIANLKGVNICVVGASKIVGEPLAICLKNLGATVTICDEDTQDLPSFTQKAEILVSATGVPDLIGINMVKKGAVVIDVGSPRGDVDFEKVKETASFITPVPGGVGPVTVVCLMENVFTTACKPT